MLYGMAVHSKGSEVPSGNSYRGLAGAVIQFEFQGGVRLAKKRARHIARTEYGIKKPMVHGVRLLSRFPVSSN